MNEVMLDLETLGIKHNAVIVSIGACRFSEQGVYDPFFALVNPASCERVGMTMDASTVMWWMQQSDEARAQFSSSSTPPVSILDALGMFTDWLNERGSVTGIWGNGSDFDNVILGNAYKAYDAKLPWSYSKNRCFRTLKSLVTRERQDELWDRYSAGLTHHNALDDAKRQAMMARSILMEDLKIWGGAATQ